MKKIFLMVSSMLALFGAYCQAKPIVFENKTNTNIILNFSTGKKVLTAKQTTTYNVEEADTHIGAISAYNDKTWIWEDDGRFKVAGLDRADLFALKLRSAPANTHFVLTDFPSSDGSHIKIR